MKTHEIVLFSYNSLKQRKLRAFLTIIGIVIGVASIVSLISIGQGVQSQVNNRLGGLGADIITVSQGNNRAAGGMGGFGGFEGFGGQTKSVTKNLTEEDVRIVRNTAGVMYAYGLVSDIGKIVYGGENADSSVQGVDTSVWRLMVTTELASGRYLVAGDTNAVVIGSRMANGTFSTVIKIGDQITIEEKVFKVVGILKSGTIGAESGIYIPKETARQIFGLDARRVDSITAKVSDAEKVSNITSEITDRLRAFRRLQEGKEDFTVSNSLAMQSQISSISSTLTLFLGAIAGISLLVGAIGISNTMFTSVMERTRQIGILKSLGATDSEVMKIFVIEASIIGLIGGVIGALLGLAVSQLIAILGGFDTLVTPQLFISSMFFAVVVGAVSGYFPAKRAAALQPVEALRYE